MQVSFRSIGAEDGYVVESSETSGVGGAANANGGQVRAGDYAANRQVKGIVSFDTSPIPDGATVVSATLRLRRQSVRGTNPFGVLGRCRIDVQTGGFGGSAALQAADFEAVATVARAGTLSNASRRGEWSTGTLDAAGLAAINRTGTTQLRIAFELDDNNNRRQDTIGWTSGDRKPAVRPELVVTYVE